MTPFIQELLIDALRWLWLFAHQLVPPDLLGVPGYFLLLSVNILKVLYLVLVVQSYGRVLLLDSLDKLCGKQSLFELREPKLQRFLQEIGVTRAAKVDPPAQGELPLLVENGYHVGCTVRGVHDKA